MKRNIPPSQRPERRQDNQPLVSGQVLEIKPHRGPIKLATPPEIYAEAVHRAVCEVRGGDGFGQCFYYAQAGHGLLSLTNHAPNYVQAGSLYLQPNPQDPTYWRACVPEAHGVDRGEFHCWLASESGVFIDFASRHFRRWVEEIIPHNGILEQGPGYVILSREPKEDVPWTRPDPPVVVWGSPHDSWDWLRYEMDVPTSRLLHTRISNELDTFKTLTKSAWRHFQELGGVAEPTAVP
jgi:hypothetical protein